MRTVSEVRSCPAIHAFSWGLVSRSWLCPAGLRISWTKPQVSDKSQCPQHGQLQLGMGLHLPGPAQSEKWGQREEEKSMMRRKKRRKGKGGYSEAGYAGSLCLAFSFVTVILQGPGWGSAHRGLLRLRMSKSPHGRVGWANSINPAQNPLPCCVWLPTMPCGEEEKDLGVHPNSYPVLLMVEPTVLLELPEHTPSHCPYIGLAISSAISDEIRGFNFDTWKRLRYINKVMGWGLPRALRMGIDEFCYNFISIYYVPETAMVFVLQDSQCHKRDRWAIATVKWSTCCRSMREQPLTFIQECSWMSACMPMYMCASMSVYTLTNTTNKHTNSCLIVKV